MSSSMRQAQSGAPGLVKSTIVIPNTAIAASTGVAITASFPGAVTGNIVKVSFRAAVGNNASVVYSEGRVSAADQVTLTFGNTGAAATVSAATIDAELSVY